MQAEQGACTAMLNRYRAMDVAQIANSKRYDKTVNRPTLFIWGTEDGVIAPSIIPRQKDLINASYKAVVLETRHGIIQTKPDTIINEILAHFKGNKI